MSINQFELTHELDRDRFNVVATNILKKMGRCDSKYD